MVPSEVKQLAQGHTVKGGSKALIQTKIRVKLNCTGNQLWEMVKANYVRKVNDGGENLSPLLG